MYRKFSPLSSFPHDSDDYGDNSDDEGGESDHVNCLKTQLCTRSDRNFNFFPIISDAQF